MTLLFLDRPAFLLDAEGAVVLLHAPGLREVLGGEGQVELPAGSLAASDAEPGVGEQFGPLGRDDLAAAGTGTRGGGHGVSFRQNGCANNAPGKAGGVGRGSGWARRSGRVPGVPFGRSIPRSPLGSRPDLVNRSRPTIVLLPFLL